MGRVSDCCGAVKPDASLRDSTVCCTSLTISKLLERVRRTDYLRLAGSRSTVGEPSRILSLLEAMAIGREPGGWALRSPHSPLFAVADLKRYGLVRSRPAMELLWEALHVGRVVDCHTIRAATAVD